MKKDRLTYWEWLDDEVDMSRVPCCDLFDLDNIPEEERDGVKKLLRRCAELEDDDGTIKVEVEVLQRDVENLTRTLEEANDEIKALEAENAALRERLSHSLELPYMEQTISRNGTEDTILYYLENGKLQQECFNNKFPEQLQARLAELKGE